MNVSPKQLRMFLALSESLNFSKTAEKLFITQPSLSKAIQDLEAELGLPLFERTTRSVRLTPGGARMAVRARSVVGELDAGLQRMQSSAEREAQQLAIAAWPSLAYAVLPEVCAALERQFRSPQLKVHDCANSACIQRLLDHQADFALASVAPSHPDLHYEELLRDRFVLLSSGKWRRQVAARIRLEELLALPLITLTDASTAMRYMSAAYLQRGIEYRPRMQVDQVATVAGLEGQRMLANEVPLRRFVGSGGKIGRLGQQLDLQRQQVAEDAGHRDDHVDARPQPGFLRLGVDDHRVAFADPVSGLHVPFDDFRLDGAFAQIRQFEHVFAHSASSTRSMARVPGG